MRGGGRGLKPNSVSLWQRSRRSRALEARRRNEGSLEVRIDRWLEFNVVLIPPAVLTGSRTVPLALAGLALLLPHTAPLKLCTRLHRRSGERERESQRERERVRERVRERGSERERGRGRLEKEQTEGEEQTVGHRQQLL